ncbi:MAG TPA: PfkB family carbohydrate kinase [Vicinamibacterales bacterium]|nr:PfkB family carbohydrate kinase [Vicinamibacterales bacterium]
MTRPWDVIGIGATSVDYVYRLPVLPEADGPQAKIRISGHRISCGGQTATALATCAALGLRAKFAGVLGSDENGARIRAELVRRGIDVSDAVVHEGRNQFAAILVDERTGERIVLWSRDDGLALRPNELSAELLASARVVHVDDVDQEGAIRAAERARASGAIVTSDIDRVTDRTEELVGAVSIPILAEHVPPALTGEKDMERALRKLRTRHSTMLCVTLGRAGAMILDGDQIHLEPAFHVNAVDTTGAGDVWRGAFIYGLLRHEQPQSLLRFANAAAAVSCTRSGAIDAVPTLADVDEMLQLA